ncbi:MAG: 6-carboxytetrahydropterin synthase [Bryobacterales bacterium]|jgi:6-pyruvoyltetrahydropterin/6-carboxytetrahydropterin synthase|nr:6-carboxytetrahydropterin synthase [Bryobacterales bacterium]
MTLTRRYRFCSAHRLHSPALSEEANQQTYGRCNNPFGHGHNYVLEVSVDGQPDAVTGRLMAIEDLDGLVTANVLRVYDGKNMNVDIDRFQGEFVPTTENVAVDVRERLERSWPEPGSPWRHTRMMPRLAGVRLFETRKNIFDI